MEEIGVSIQSATVVKRRRQTYSDGEFQHRKCDIAALGHLCFHSEHDALIQ